MQQASFNKFVIFLAILLFSGGWEPLLAQSEITIGRVKYRGGGDWYNDPSSLTNLIEFTSELVNMNMSTRYEDVALGSADLNDYPFLFLTGHGTITASRSETDNLRDYLDNGGFLYVDDDYGLDPHIRKLLKEAFPDEELVEIPFEHPIYHQLFDFERGLPKIHEHDNKEPKAFGLFRRGRMVVFYTYESNLGDGWADPEVHNDPPEVRREALQMGSNILIYALTH
jgi:hypothetical protein